ncbi:hypothetical protein BGZ46_001743 [Entomortierella lignicola]|nr:hypothetical protein BGZ46_001743 [Entomortierella lignicola]
MVKAYQLKLGDRGNMEELPGHQKECRQSEEEIPLESILDVLQPVDITIKDTLGEAQNGFPGYLEGFGQPESRLTLDKFSMQATSIGDQSDEKLNTNLGLTFYKDALKIVDLFGIMKFGHVVECQGVYGYDPERIWKSELSYCCPLDFKGSPSAFLEVHNIGVYGSGGLPEPLRESLKTERINSAVLIESDARQYSPDNVNLSSRSQGDHITSRRLAWCRAARAIEICWRVSSTLDRDWGGWLLKVAVHAACTLQGARCGFIRPPSAVIILCQLGREIAYGLTWIVCDVEVSTKMAAIAAMLIEAGFGFISAGLWQMLSQPLNEELACLLYGLAIASETSLSSLFRLVPKNAELVRNSIRSTNFCPARHISTTMERHSRVMFHLVARAKHLETPLNLHSTCGDICKKAISKDNHYEDGHLPGKCAYPTKLCQVKSFEPKETAELVLFDTERKELVTAEPGALYVAVSQVWFQGLFGQSSRKCGECILHYLRTACISLGVRYAWIDTLCMPTGEDLRKKVIVQLKYIYLNAGATLVVDAGLISTKARSVLDLSLAILLSDWSSRIWTLQEGVLASKLLFCVGGQVLALPQMNGLPHLLDTQNWVSSRLLKGYGLKEEGVDMPLQSVLSLAYGRQTSYPCDDLYGLSALFPSVPVNRAQDPEQVAIEVAQIYNSIDLGLLMSPLDRCKTVGYRWMPLGAKALTKEVDTGIQAFIAEGGLDCYVTAFIKLTSISGRDVIPSQLMLAVGTVKLVLNIKYWYSTEIAGVFVGTSVKADHMRYCLVGHSDDDRSFGFVVSPTNDGGAFQYLGEAAAVGKIGAQPRQILVS